MIHLIKYFSLVIFSVICFISSAQTTEGEYVRGEKYGGCLQQLDGSFKVTYSEAPIFPMVSCPGAGSADGTPACAPGFRYATVFSSQMNTNHSGAVASTGTIGAIIQKLNSFLDGDIYWRTFVCMVD